MPVSLVAALTGCEAAQHTAIDAGAAGGGAAIGYAVDKKNPYGAAIGGAGGLLVGEAVNYGISSQKKTQYQEGYNKGRSDEVKTLYWAQRAAHRADRGRRPAPAQAGRDSRGRTAAPRTAR